MGVGMREFRERVGEGIGEPVLDSENGEEIIKVSPHVAIVLGNRAPESHGTLYITSTKVIWLSDVDMRKGYAVDFLSISLHAISRDPEAYPSPCIYAQIETGDEDEDDSEDSESESNDALDLSKITEMRLIPSDPSQLDELFEVFCDCAELNPDPNEEGEEEEHNWIFSADQMVDEVEGEDRDWPLSQNPPTTIGHSNGHNDLSHRVLELQINDQRFEDADEMDRDDPGSGHR